MKTKREESNTLTLNTGKVSLVGVLSLINDFVLKTQRISENVHCKKQGAVLLYIRKLAGSIIIAKIVTQKVAVASNKLFTAQRQTNA